MIAYKWTNRQHRTQPGSQNETQHGDVLLALLAERMKEPK